MNEEYLWNRSGEGDSDIVRLERLLAPMRYRERAGRVWIAPRWLWLAAAALVACLIAAPLVWVHLASSNWQLSTGRRLRAGQWIEPGESEAVTIESQETGELRIDPGSRLRLPGTGSGQERFSLQRGTIHAFIWAPPGRFVVNTPSATSIDLGCRYTLHVGRDGGGLLTVEFGWVAFESNGKESFIPEGAACETRPTLGPGTPYFSDAPPTLIAALSRFDAAPDGRPDAGALQDVLKIARPRDGLTLWHLLKRTGGEQRAEVFDRFAALQPLPDSISREAILRGDAAAFDAAWNALQLGSTGWWREWKRRW